MHTNDDGNKDVSRHIAVAALRLYEATQGGDGQTEVETAHTVLCALIAPPLPAAVHVLAGELRDTVRQLSMLRDQRDLTANDLAEIDRQIGAQVDLLREIAQELVGVTPPQE